MNKIVRDNRGRFVKGKMTGPNNPFYGKHHTDEAKKKMKTIKKELFTCGNLNQKGSFNNFYGKKHTEEWRKQHSKIMKKKYDEGYTSPMEGQTPWNKYMKGRYRIWDDKPTKNKLRGIKISKSKTGIRFPKDEYPHFGLRASRKKIVFPVKDTKIEVKIQNCLKLLHVEFMTHYYISEIIHSYQCDILIPKQETEGILVPQKTIIECDGCYFHNCPICQPKVGNGKLSERVLKQREIDEVRTKELQAKGYNVIRFWEHDIKKMEINDLKEKLI